MRTGLFILIILCRRVEIDNIGDGLELWLEAVTRLKNNHHVKLANMEKVDQTFELIFWELWIQNKAFQVETIEEEFDSISLNYIISVD